MSPRDCGDGCRSVIHGPSLRAILISDHVAGQIQRPVVPGFHVNSTAGSTVVPVAIRREQRIVALARVLDRILLTCVVLRVVTPSFGKSGSQRGTATGLGRIKLGVDRAFLGGVKVAHGLESVAVRHILVVNGREAHAVAIVECLECAADGCAHEHRACAVVGIPVGVVRGLGR
ncbi:hypothetical protein D9M72_282780 [compost metagenome]